jgi:multisubunit Na+/H+ antiporter MnhE subunit
MTWVPGFLAVLLVGWVAATRNATSASTTVGLFVGFVVVTLLIRRRERRR